MKTRNLIQSSLRNNPINCWMHGGSFRNFEDKDGIQAVISPYSLDQFLISSTPRTRKRARKGKKSIDSRIMVSRQFDFTQKSRGSIFVAKNTEFIEEKRHNHRINGPNEASFDQNGAIKLHLFDR